MASVFDYINSINNKNYIWNDNSEKEFNTYITLSAFSYYPDTIFFANELNKFQKISKKEVYDFLFYVVPCKKRWSPWNKQDKKEREFNLQVAQLYNIGIIEAKSLIQLLNNEELNRLKETLKGIGGK